jgi:hypothetical protein
MSELELLYLVLALIYSWECVCWVRRGSLLMVSWLGRHWSIAHPGALLGNQQGGFLFAPPLPPLGTVLQLSQFPLSMDSESVLAFVATAINPGGRPPQTGRFIRFADIQKVEARGRKVRVNGELLVRTGSKGLAASIVQTLEAMRKSSKKEREKTIAGLERLDASGLDERWRQFQQRTRSLQLLTNGLFLYLFIIAPTVIWTFGLEHNWLPMLIGLLGMTSASSILFRKAHVALYPALDEDRFTHTLTVLLSPVTAIRARDILSRLLLEQFHPLVVLKTFSAPKQFEEHARQYLREIRHPAKPWCSNTDPVAAEVELRSRDRLRRSVEQFLKSSGLDPDILDKAPEPADALCVSYCPHCLAQFTSSSGVCEDCGGLDLVRFQNTAATIVPVTSK